MGRRTVGEKSLGLLLINPRIMLFFLLHIAFVVKSVGKHIWTLKESSSVYILNIGGFGHTITQAETYFAYIDPEGKVIALLTPGAHNLNILSLYPGSYFVINRTKFFSMIDKKKERLAIQLSELVAIKILFFIRVFFFRLPKIYDWRSLVALVSNERMGSHGRGILELFYDLYRDDTKNALIARNHVNSDLYNQLINDLKQRFPKKRFCSFYFRSKGVEGSDHVDDYTRNSRSLMDLIPLFKHLEKEGFIILLYGDEPPTFKNQARSNGVVFYDDVNWGKNLWDLWVGGIGEFTLGSPGGGLLIPVIFGRKILVIDGFGYWFGLPNAMHTYKLVFTANGQLLSPLIFIKSNPWQLNFSPGSYIEFLPIEVLQKVFSEFYTKLSTWPSMNTFNSEIHEDNWISISPNAIVSEEYLRFIHSKL